MSVDPVERKSGGALVGCLFVVCAVIAVFMAFGTAMAVTVSLGTNSTNPVGLAIATGLTSAAICAFFVMVSRRLYAAWRGRDVPHLIPPVLAVPLALALGVGGLFAMFTSARAGSYRGAGASVVFIAYAIRMIWTAITKKVTQRAG